MESMSAHKTEIGSMLGFSILLRMSAKTAKNLKLKSSCNASVSLPE
jgi:hypothetical protein